MKRVISTIAFVGLFLLSVLPSDAQFNRECRYGFCTPHSGASGNPISNACTASSGTTITFTAQNVGGANPNRISVVSINWSDSTAAGTAELTGVTLGGNAMVRAVRASGDDQNSNSEIWYVANPTGTTANIVLSASTAIDGITIEVYSLIGYNSFVPVTTTVGTTSVSQAYTNKQLAIGAGSRTTNVSTSLSNMVNDFSSACGANLWGVHASQRLSGNGTLTSAISPTGNNPKIALAVWAQAAPACSQATAFIARTSGLNTLHQNAYTALICGLVSDGVFAKLDVLHVYASQTSANALLNLPSSSFNGVTNGSPVFTTDRGFQGVDGSTTVYINTQYDPTVSSPAGYTQNSAHVSVWNLTNTNFANPAIGCNNSSYLSAIFVRNVTSIGAYINTNFVGGTATNPTPQAGFYTVSRNGTSATVDIYKNGVALGSGVSSGSQTVTGVCAWSTLAYNIVPGSRTGSGNLVAAATIGSGLSATNVADLNARMRTYMTAVGVP